MDIFIENNIFLLQLRHKAMVWCSTDVACYVSVDDYGLTAFFVLLWTTKNRLY